MFVSAEVGEVQSSKVGDQNCIKIYRFVQHGDQLAFSLRGVEVT